MSQLLRIMIIKKLTSVKSVYTGFDDLNVFRITFQLRGGVIVDYSSDLQYPVGKATSSDRQSCPLHGKRSKKMIKTFGTKFALTK